MMMESSLLHATDANTVELDESAGHQEGELGELQIEEEQVQPMKPEQTNRQSARDQEENS